MKTIRSITAMIAVASLCLATAAWAQQERGSQAGSQGILRASQLIGAEIQNQQGEELGTVEDVALDPQTSDIAYVVLASGGFLGLGEKYFAIPWRSFEQQAGETDTLVLNMAQDRLREAPGFDKDNWPDMANRQWGQDVHTFYGQTPYWERERAMQSGSQPGQGIAATVQEVDQTSGNLKLKTTEGKTVELQAPQQVVSDFQQNDRVQVIVRKESQAQQQSTQMQARSSQQQERVTATVQNVDQASGNITLQMADGETVDMQVSDKMASKLQTGDRVQVELQKSQQGQQAQSQQGMQMQQQERVTATVQNVDQTSRKLELQTAEGKTIELQAPEALISDLQAGDSVEVIIHPEGQSSQSGQSSGKKSQQGQSGGKQSQPSGR